jgi:hypothetical protein
VIIRWTDGTGGRQTASAIGQVLELVEGGGVFRVVRAWTTWQT